MENNILNALNFLFQTDPRAEAAVDNGYDISMMYNGAEWISKMVAYAASVRPVVVLPSEVSIEPEDSALFRQKAHTWNACLDAIRRLNPGLTFTESN